LEEVGVVVLLEEVEVVILLEEVEVVILLEEVEVVVLLEEVEVVVLLEEVEVVVLLEEVEVVVLLEEVGVVVLLEEVEVVILLEEVEVVILLEEVEVVCGGNGSGSPPSPWSSSGLIVTSGHDSPVTVLVIAVTELVQPLIIIDENVEQLVVETPAVGMQETKKSVTVVIEQLEVGLDLDVVELEISDVLDGSSIAVVEGLVLLTSIGARFPSPKNPWGTSMTPARAPAAIAIVL
jgi:hypothetical protein